MPAMDLGDGIRKHGFRKWYERELLQSHAHLVLTFLCTIGLFGGFEAYGLARNTSDRLVNVAAIAICAAVGVWALRRYLRLLMRAEHLAHQADCPGCGTYGRLRCTGPTTTAQGVEVSCSKCGHRWTLVE